jgi:hypothetical protein
MNRDVSTAKSNLTECCNHAKLRKLVRSAERRNDDGERIVNKCNKKQGRNQGITDSRYGIEEKKDKTALLDLLARSIGG